MESALTGAEPNEQAKIARDETASRLRSLPWAMTVK